MENLAETSGERQIEIIGHRSFEKMRWQRRRKERIAIHLDEQSLSSRRKRYDPRTRRRERRERRDGEIEIYSRSIGEMTIFLSVIIITVNWL